MINQYQHSMTPTASQCKTPKMLFKSPPGWLARDLYLACLESSFTAEGFHNQLKKSDENSEIVPKELRSEECM